ncbi:YceD family protein [Rhodoligotrophos defluvii]|uniref:YceD family protein n=1 Tax=Rhodoligotrophos defluvii TaxID=2561934 RepID=UPI0010C99E34|nr:DUF177 domain-containing protein [Rhodoligotrophos defluvii]
MVEVDEAGSGGSSHPDGFKRPFEIAAVGEDGLEERLVATQAEREVLAGWLGLARLDALEAKLSLKPWRGNGVRVSGQLHAEAEQVCVVTLEPLQRVYEQEFERSFIQGPAPVGEGATEAVVDIAGEDPPDVIENGVIDLGAVVAEELALVIDPYPRKEGAEIESGYAAQPEEKQDETPFAALLALKKAIGPEDNGR